MKRISILTFIMMALAACSPKVDMTNPASVNCQQNGYNLQIRTAEDGSQGGICVFPDGSSCDEWAYYRGECGPAVADATTEASSNDSGGTDPGSSMPAGSTEKIVDWWGVIKSTEPGSQYDDYFERQDLGQIILFGIDSTDPAVQTRIETLRNSGRTVHLYGTLVSNMPDYNGSQIVVDRLEVEE